MKELSITEYMLLHYGQEDALLLDIRDETVFLHGTIPGAVNLPLKRIGELYDLPRDKTIYVFCQSDEISREIVEILEDADYDAVDLTGGFRQFLRDLAEGKYEHLQLTI